MVADLFASPVELTEKRVIELALEKNLGIKIAEAERDAGKTYVEEARSIFDTWLDFKVDYLVDKSDRAIPVFGTDNRELNFNLGVSKILPSGTRTSIDWENRRDSTDSTFALLNPYYESRIAFSIEQPLLSNFFGKGDRGTVNVARKEFEATDAYTERKIMLSVFEVLYDYWRWVADQTITEMTRRSMNEALHLEEIAKKKEKLGLCDRTDVLASRANRLQVETWFENSRRQEEDSLGRLYHGLDLDGSDMIVSHDKIPFSKVETTREDALAVALSARADYVSARRSLEAKNIEVALAKNSKWPEIDLVSSVKLNGIDADYTSSLSENRTAEHPAYYVGAEFSWPIENRNAASKADRAVFEKRKALFRLKEAEHQVVRDVEEQYRGVETLYRQVHAYQKIEGLQREKWEEELGKYKKGRSGSDLVVRFQEDYLAAQRATVNALFSYHMAVLGLKLAQNKLIQ